MAERPVGLKREAGGFWQLPYQSISLVSPAGAMAAGSSGAITLGEETHQPHRLIRNAVMTSFGFSAALFLLLADALTVGWGPSRMPLFARASIPGVILARQDIGLFMAVVLLLFVVNSLLAGSLAPEDSLVRMLYAFARDRTILPDAMSQVHATRRAPHQAILWSLLVGFVVSLVAWVYCWGRSRAFWSS